MSAQFRRAATFLSSEAGHRALRPKRVENNG
jgi:hypothetical protein